MTSDQVLKLRDPGLNERRCIARDHLDFYRGLAVAGTYSFEVGTSVAALLGSLKATIKEHPSLTTTIQDGDSEHPTFQRSRGLKLEDHVIFWHAPELSGGDESSGSSYRALTKRLAEYVHRLKFEKVGERPPWKAVIAPLESEMDAVYHCVIVYLFSHSIGDGASGVLFHRTLLENINASTPSNQDATMQEVILPSTKGLPDAIDSPKLLPISWSFLFSALLGESQIWKRLKNLAFGEPLQSQESLWTGAPHFYDAETFETAVEVLFVKHNTVQAVLSACKEHEAKFTGVLHQLIGAAISLQLKRNGQECTHLVSSTPINLRSLLRISQDDMGVIASNATITHQIGDTNEVGSEPFWQASRINTAKVAQVAGTLDDHPVGLLRYLSSIRAWMTQKVGEERDVSYDLSNAMMLDPEPAAGGRNGANLTDVWFSQPGDVTGPAMSFNVVSLKNGPLAVCMSWQIGALGLRFAEDGSENTAEVERIFVAGIRDSIEQGISRLSS